jgi:peptidylprolyl isomerase
LVNLATKNIIVGLIAAGLLLTAGVLAAEKKDSTTAKGPNVIVGEVAKPSKKGRPTAMLVGDTILTASGLKFIEVRPGTGGMPRTGQTVSIHYVGTFRDGKQFLSTRDSSVAYEFVIGKGSEVKGLEEGVASMHIGGIRRLIVPYQLAWGDKGDAKRVPPKTDVIFEVELLAVK